MWAKCTSVFFSDGMVCVYRPAAIRIAAIASAVLISNFVRSAGTTGWEQSSRWARYHVAARFTASERLDNAPIFAFGSMDRSCGLRQSNVLKEPDFLRPFLSATIKLRTLHTWIRAPKSFGFQRGLSSPTGPQRRASRRVSVSEWLPSLSDRTSSELVRSKKAMKFQWLGDSSRPNLLRAVFRLALHSENAEWAWRRVVARKASRLC